MKNSELRPDTVKQMIQVLIRFRDKYRRSYKVDKAHIEAVEEVAKMHNHKGNTTVRDLCGRRLELPSIFKFRNLLEKWMLGEPKPLLELLKKFTPSSFHAEIEAILVDGNSNTTSSSLNTPPSSMKVPQRLDENFSFSLEPEIAKKLKVLSVMKGISTFDFLRNIVKHVVKHDYNQWLNRQKSNEQKSFKKE